MYDDCSVRPVPGRRLHMYDDCSVRPIPGRRLHKYDDCSVRPIPGRRLHMKKSYLKRRDTISRHITKQI